MTCTVCHKEYSRPSLGGPGICPSCDCGIPPRTAFDQLPEALPSRYRDGVDSLTQPKGSGEQPTSYMPEIWVPIHEYSGLYEVSNTGKVRSIQGRYAGRELRAGKRTRNYLSVDLFHNNRKRSFYIHRLVAAAFLSNPEKKKTVNHKDSNPANNNLSNLEWATDSENIKHAYDFGGKLTWNSPKRKLKGENNE